MATSTTTMHFAAQRLRVRACYDSSTDDGYVMLQLADVVFPCGDLYEPEGQALFVYANWREFQELVAACVNFVDDPAWSGWHRPALAITAFRSEPTAPARYLLSDANRDVLELSREEIGHMLRIYFVVVGLALVLQTPEMRHGGTRSLRFRHEINGRSLFLFASVRLLVAFSVAERLRAYFVRDTRCLLLDADEAAELVEFDRSMRNDWQYDYTHEHAFRLGDGETVLCISQSLQRELAPNQLHLHYEDWKLLLQCVQAYLALQRYVASLSTVWSSTEFEPQPAEFKTPALPPPRASAGRQATGRR